MFVSVSAGEIEMLVRVLRLLLCVKNTLASSLGEC